MTLRELQEDARGVMAEYGSNKMSYMMIDLDKVVAQAYHQGRKDQLEEEHLQDKK